MGTTGVHVQQHYWLYCDASNVRDMWSQQYSQLESKLDVLQSQLDKFKMKDGEGVAEMYSRISLITNEIAS